MLASMQAIREGDDAERDLVVPSELGAHLQAGPGGSRFFSAAHSDVHQDFSIFSQFYEREREGDDV